MARGQEHNRLRTLITATGWRRLVATGTVAFIVAYVVFALSVSGVARFKNPQLALMLFPQESAALAARSDQIFFARPEQPAKAVEILAKAALQQQPTNAKALRLLGFFAEINKQPLRAKKLVTLASKLSRREPGAQLWLIEYTARNGSDAETLRHYDTLLRTKPDSSGILYPRLLNAISDASLRADLKPYIKLNRSWMSGFLNFALANAKDSTVVSDLIVENGGFPKSEFSKAQNAQLLQRLTQEKHFAEAKALFLLIPGAADSRLKSATFDSQDADGRFGAMGWTIGETADAAFDLDKVGSKQKTTLSFGIAPATTSVIARKLLYLPSGNYSFRVRLAKLAITKDGALRWQLRCAKQNENPVFWSINTPTNSLSSEFAVAPDCQVQILEIIASGGSGTSGWEGAVSDISVAALNR